MSNPLDGVFRQVAAEFLTELDRVVTDAAAEQVARRRATERGADTSEETMGSTEGVEVASELEDEPFAARVERARYRPASQSEGALAEEVLADLNARPGHLFRKVHQGAASGSGEPDLDGCVYGRAVKIELKVRGGTRKAAPTPKQHRALLQWQAAGAHVGVATSLQEVDDILARLGDPTYRYNGQIGAGPPIAPPEPEA